MIMSIPSCWSVSLRAIHQWQSGDSISMQGMGYIPYPSPTNSHPTAKTFLGWSSISYLIERWIAVATSRYGVRYIASSTR